MDGKLVEVGSGRVLDEDGVAPEPEPGQILIHVRIDKKWVGAFAMEDSLRVDAAITVQSFKDFGVEHVIMITGDAKGTAESVANAVGINEVYPSLMPKQKVEVIEKAVHPVAAIGDGVNDAPVLTTADVGIAMGARGSSAASESADVVVMLDDIYRAARSVSIGQRTMKIAMQAIGIGVGLSVILMLIATGVMPAVVGAFMRRSLTSRVSCGRLAARPGRGEVSIDDVLAENPRRKNARNATL